VNERVLGEVIEEKGKEGTRGLRPWKGGYLEVGAGGLKRELLDRNGIRVRDVSNSKLGVQRKWDKKKRGGGAFRDISP